MKKKFVVIFMLLLLVGVTACGKVIKNDNNSNTNTSVKDKIEGKIRIDDETLKSRALDYFLKNASDVLSRDSYSVGISDEVIDEYKDMNMNTIEIRHINDGNNSLDARYFINVYTAKGYDDVGNEIDLNN